MKIRHLEKRLRKVESTLRCKRDVQLDIIAAMRWFAVAYYLGNPSRDEKPFAAYARALGYASESELNRALENKDRDLLKRVVTADVKLYEKFDCTLESDETKFREALERMLSGLPGSYVDEWARIMTRAKISLVWLRDESNDIAAYIRYFA
jgi:hypothetical protein